MRWILRTYLIKYNEYYQKFSYSIKSDLPYDKWKESVRAIVHPSGFKEFSDLELLSQPTVNEVNVGIAKSTNMRIKAVDTKIDMIVNIDNDIYMGRRENFAMVTEDDPLPDGSVQRIFFPEGRPIKSYILNKTNKVLKLDDISDGFTGQYNRSGVLEGKTDFKLRSNGNPVFNLASGISLMLFYAFALQCMSTLAIVKKETNSWKWPSYQFIIMGAIAYLVSLLAYQTLI